MFEGMDIPWVSALDPIKPHAEFTRQDLTSFGPAGFELVRRIMVRALEPFPEAAYAVAEALRENHRALVNARLIPEAHAMASGKLAPPTRCAGNKGTNEK